MSQTERGDQSEQETSDRITTDPRHRSRKMNPCATVNPKSRQGVARQNEHHAHRNPQSTNSFAQSRRAERENQTLRAARNQRHC
jgi:hypothetical protein